MSAFGSGPSFSVVIPYYRGQAVLRDAVESVLAQTVQPHEIVVCDDGSPDDIKAALGDLAEHVKVLRRQHNKGIAAAMNATTEAAEGDFLVQLDQDDAFLPRRIEAIAAAIARDPGADIVATDAIVEYGGRPVIKLSESHPFETGDPRTAILRRCFFLWPAIRRSRLIAVGGYDESFPVMQDWECFIRLVLDGASIAYVDEPLYRWRLTPGSRSSADGEANASALIRMIEKTLSTATLTDAERATAESSLAAHECRMVTERALGAIESGAPDARRRSLELATAKGFGPARRAKGALAAISPGLARRLLMRRARSNPGVEALAQRGFPRPG